MCVIKPRLLKNALRNQVAAHMLTAFTFHHWIVIALVSMDTECKGGMMFTFDLWSSSLHFGPFDVQSFDGDGCVICAGASSLSALRRDESSHGTRQITLASPTRWLLVVAQYWFVPSPGSAS